MTSSFKSEAEMIEAWLAALSDQQRSDWTVYAETAGWDILMVHRDGYQLGIEAKLSLNAKVLEQTLSGCHSYYDLTGPDYRAVLVPADKVQHHMGAIAKALGITIIRVNPPEPGVWRYVELPDQDSDYRAWPNWCPAERCVLPDYIPDVAAGHSAPVQLTAWKVKAIKLMIWLERHGCITRADMKALQISPTRWTDSYVGFLSPGGNGAYVRNDRTPDLRAQHPVNYAQIEADIDAWSKDLPARVTELPPDLFASREGLAAAPI